MIRPPILPLAQPYEKLRLAHAAHHAHPAEDGKDPDFHPGGLGAWLAEFCRRYVTQGVLLRQGVLNALAWPAALAAVACSPLFGLPPPPLRRIAATVLLFMILPALAASVQLFYFGIYLPHRRAEV